VEVERLLERVWIFIVSRDPGPLNPTELGQAMQSSFEKKPEYVKAVTADPRTSSPRRM
jgi:hypothetical protein